MPIRKVTKNTRGRTISRDLILGLTLTLVVIVCIIGVLYYAYTASIAKRDLETYADHVARQFSQDIALPLFNFEVETVRHIAKASLQAESLVGISVTVDSTLVFENTPETMTGLFKREKKVIWEGETVGMAKLIFTREKIEKEQRSWIWLMAFILSCVILTIALATHFIMKSFLNRPLQRLTLGIQSIADGDYTSPLEPVVHSDINVIVGEINRMADQITKRSRQLAESEAKYRRIFENAVEGMYKTSIHGRFLDANPAMASILGYDSPDDVIRKITEISRQLYVRAEIRQEFLKQLEANNIVQGFEQEVYRKDGSRIWVESNARAIRDSEGKLVGMEGFIMDVSRRKQMEIDLKQAQEELERRVRERTLDLEEKTTKLERMNKLFIDRELRMKELKAEIEDLRMKIEN